VARFGPGTIFGENRVSSSRSAVMLARYGEMEMSASGRKSRACIIYYQGFNHSPLLYREAKALREKGFEVDVICLSESRNNRNPYIPGGMKIYSLQSRNSRENCNCMYFARVFLFFLKCALLLSILGPVRRYSIVHVTSPPDFMVFAAFIPKLLGSKIILDIHDINPEFYMRKKGHDGKRLTVRILRLLERCSVRFSDHAITVTELWRRMLITRSVYAEKCTVIMNVPDDGIFRPSLSRMRKEKKRFNLLYHGSLEEHFGVDTLLDAMVYVREKIPNVLLTIYGSGRLKGVFEEFIEKENMGDHVRMRERVPFHELPDIIQEADIGIVPTKSAVFSGEALSMKSFEYLVLGVPIVISETKGHRHYFSKEFVKFFDPQDPRDLAGAIVDLHEDGEARDRMVENSKEFLARHNWKHYKQLYFDIIDELTMSG
jgi:glycosyltransferase involved in cell wall biosynthesis